MNADLIDPQAVLRLRALCKLDHARLARLCGLTEAQVRELEEGGHSQFASSDLKVQAALKVATTLSGTQANGMPVVNVFRSRAAADGLGVQLPAFKIEETTQPAPPKFPDSPEFFKLLLIFVVVVFLLVAVAMPLLYTLPSPPPKLS
jgi:transcriptional regulator with XRE-family HTH domain